jgi:hypothetical protein
MPGLKYCVRTCADGWRWEVVIEHDGAVVARGIEAAERTARTAALLAALRIINGTLVRADGDAVH